VATALLPRPTFWLKSLPNKRQFHKQFNKTTGQQHGALNGTNNMAITYEDNLNINDFQPVPLATEPAQGKSIDLNQINAICRISIAPPDQILEWSRRHHRQSERLAGLKAGKTIEELEASQYGEVKKPETINYRTFKPEKDGLFCERIFGPTKDWECACGKYKRIKYKGIICDRCGVEVTESKVRRVRMGHIKLAAPVCHIWFYKGTNSRISNLLDISVRDLGKVIYFQDYIVVDPGESPLKKNQILSDEEAAKYKEVYGDKVSIKIGAEAVRDLLNEIDLEDLCTRLSMEMRETKSAQRRNKIIKRLKVAEAFRGSNNKPDWMIMDILPVIPPDLRPLVHLDGGRFATSDLNDLYRRVINRNNRLKRLTELRAPDVILRNEKRMLQESVDALFDNSRRSRPTKGHNNRPLKSLSDMLKGKQGRFRQNLLGKRVDYSGRSVIVCGPELKFNECGLPKKMALELFDPFIIRELERRDYAATIKTAKKMIERGDPVVYDILDDVIQNHPVLLNRAPTLHRLGVQAFMPKLVEGKAIRLHPLACAAFNADFDGDQMAVHVPLSNEAVMEARMLMLAENNILSPQNGRPIAAPSQDVILGCFYLTKRIHEDKGEGMIFASPSDVMSAHAHGVIALHAEIKVRLPEEEGRLITTTVGRVIFAESFPRPEVFYAEETGFYKETFTKKNLGSLIAHLHANCTANETAQALDAIKSLGFEYARRGGMSICMNDMLIPKKKEKILASSKKKEERVRNDYGAGHITNAERYNKIIDIWTHATEDIAREMMQGLKKDQTGMNPVYIMSMSGARGSESQIRQLAGMRGLMQKPTKKLTGGIGEIIESPITSNFREGLTVLEYFISTHGARKGLADTALKTSDAGYLTRRLVDIAQDLIITEEDCGTNNGITVSAIKEITNEGEQLLESLSARVSGRVPVTEVKHPSKGHVIVQAGEMISHAMAREIEDAGIEELTIRSVLTCESKQGICTRCYGRNMATNKMVEMGEAVGVIAAQSIGEPGTQLTLRTFHIGGAASRQLEGWYQAADAGKMRYKGIKTVDHTLEDGTKVKVAINRTGSITVEDEGEEIQTLPNIRYGSRIFFDDEAPVAKGDRLVEWDPHHTPIVAETGGEVRFADIIQGVTMRSEVDPVTNIAQRVITEHREERHPAIQLVDNDGEIIAQYALAADTILGRDVEDGAKVKGGETLARIPRSTFRSKDITGGLPRIDELFEARKPKDAAILTEITGTVHFRGISKGNRKIVVENEQGKEVSYSVPGHRHLTVRDGEKVNAGDALTDGSLSPHDILAVRGEKDVQEFLLSEVQEVYRLQGVNINDKHIECIIRQMLKKVIIDDVGTTSFLYGQQVDKHEFLRENERVKDKGGQPATAKPRLLGLTKASLETESFISAASFQETTRVLTDAAVRGRIDRLVGLKENVIMGLLIPAGSGLPQHRKIDVVPQGAMDIIADFRGSRDEGPSSLFKDDEPSAPAADDAAAGNGSAEMSSVGADDEEDI
jgi:DNA-directed RNA polymerase subunit beta'